MELDQGIFNLLNCNLIMKKDTHPTDYQIVIIEDTSNGEKFLTKATLSKKQIKDTAKWEDGNEYPVLKVHISSTSHPFFTGEERVIDVEGRVDKFKARAEAAKLKQEAMINKAKKEADRKAKAEQNNK
jgi:large subunit ribosomal protein L31